MSKVRGFLRKSLNRSNNNNNNNDSPHQVHPVVTVASSIPKPMTLKTAKKAFDELKNRGNSNQKKGAALESINRYFLQQPHLGERYFLRRGDFKGLESVVSSIKNPSSDPILKQQINVFNELKNADETIMEAVTRPPGQHVKYPSAHDNGDMGDILCLAQQLLRRPSKKLMKTIRRTGSLASASPKLSRSSLTVIQSKSNMGICGMSYDANQNTCSYYEDVSTACSSTSFKEDNNNELKNASPFSISAPVASVPETSTLSSQSNNPSIPSEDIPATTFSSKENNEVKSPPSLPPLAPASSIPQPPPLPSINMDTSPPYVDFSTLCSSSTSMDEENNNSIKAPPLLPCLAPASTIPPPPPLPLMNKNPPPPPPLPGTPMVACAGGAPPPPPPPGGFNFLKCEIVRPLSVKCIKYQKFGDTLNCRWTAINDSEARNTIFDVMKPEKFPDDFIQKIERVFTKKQPLLSNRMSITERPVAAIALSTICQKKKMAIEITLKKLKMSVVELIRVISTSSDPNVSKDSLESLLKNFPTDNELEPYKAVISSDNFSEADLFCYEAARHPGFKFLVELIVARQEMKADMIRTAKSLKLVQDAFDAVIAHYPEWICICEKIWQIGNFLNQKTNNYGAAGFIFNDLNRLLQMNAEESKVSLLEFLLENLGPLFKGDLLKISQLKPVIEDAGKQLLEEITGIIDADSKKVDDMRARLEEVDIAEEMKYPARNDLENISLHVSEQRTSIQHLNDTKLAVFTYLVVKNMPINEFFTYIGQVITTIDAAIEKQFSSSRIQSPFNRQTPGRFSYNDRTPRFDRNSILRHSLASRRERIDE